MRTGLCLAAAIATILGVACSSFGAGADPPAAVDVDASSSSSSSSSGVPMPDGDDPGCLACPTGAFFCDGFERKELKDTGGWSFRATGNEKLVTAPDVIEKLGCGLHLHAEIGDNRTTGYVRTLSRLLLIPDDKNELAISFDARVSKRGTMFQAGDWSAFAILSADEFVFNKPYLALMVDQTGFALVNYVLGSGATRSTLTLDEQPHRITWTVRRSGVVAVSADGASILATAAPPYVLTGKPFLSIGLASPQGKGASEADFDNLVIETK